MRREGRKVLWARVGEREDSRKTSHEKQRQKDARNVGSREDEEGPREIVGEREKGNEGYK